MGRDRIFCILRPSTLGSLWDRWVWSNLFGLLFVFLFAWFLPSPHLLFVQLFYPCPSIRIVPYLSFSSALLLHTSRVRHADLLHANSHLSKLCSVVLHEHKPELLGRFHVRRSVHYVEQQISETGADTVSYIAEKHDSKPARKDSDKLWVTTAIDLIDNMTEAGGFMKGCWRASS